MGCSWREFYVPNLKSDSMYKHNEVFKDHGITQLCSIFLRSITIKNLWRSNMNKRGA